MQKTPPTKAKLTMMVVFALSCFLLLLYVWKAFGGSSPLAAKEYELRADFNEATQLADTADVRISGVTVGRVKRTELDRDRTAVTMKIEAKYAPLPRDTQAILRQKTLLGETYVELTPGDRRSGELPDGAELPRAQVKPTVELDEVLRALDKRTRRDLQRVLGELSTALRHRGQSLNDVLGQLPAFTADTDEMLAVLDAQHRSVRRLVRDAGLVFEALGERQGELAGLVRAGDRVLATTAARDRDLAEAVRILPTTLEELRPTLASLRALAVDAGPVVRDLRPAGRALAPTLIDAAAIAPELEPLFRDVDRVTSLSRTAVPALTRVVREARPVVQILVPTLKEAYPVVEYAGLYKQEVVTAISNLAASTQASEGGGFGGDPIHYLRALVPFTSEGAVAEDQRFGTNRHNPYFVPLALLKLKDGLESFDCDNVNNPGSGEPAPPCKVQKPLPFQGRATAFPQLRPDP